MVYQTTNENDDKQALQESSGSDEDGRTETEDRAVSGQQTAGPDV